MNRSLEVFCKLYKPLSITKINNAYMLKCMDGDFIVKTNPKIDYSKLYKYLESRNFNYVPKLSIDSRDDMIALEYIEEVECDKNQKILDLINLVSLLHSKTSYFKEVVNDKYKEIYEDILNNIMYSKNYYENLFERCISIEYNSPSNMLFLNYYTLIYNALNYCLERLEEWYLLVKDSNKQRVALVHNNLKLEHFIKSKQDYLISWDRYTFDTPVLDLYVLYKNEWENGSFIEVLNKYNSEFKLLEEEKILLKILISIPYVNKEDINEYNRCRSMRTLINYLNKSSKIIEFN